MIKKIIPIPEVLLPGVTFTWTLDDTLIATLDCRCPVGPSCCDGPEAEAFARLNLYQVIAPPPGIITRPQPGSSLTQVIDSGQSTRKGGTRLCAWPGAVKLSVHNYTGTVGITIGLEWLLEVSSTTVSLNASETCRCNPDPRCSNPATSRPPVLKVPNQFVVPQGKTASEFVWVEDQDDDVVAIDASEGATVMNYIRDLKGRIIGAEIAIPSTLKSVRVMATDVCGNAAAVERPVIVVHSPKIEVKWEGWERNRYMVWAWASDEDLRCYWLRCKPWVFERLTLTLGLVSSGGGEFHLVPGWVSSWEWLDPPILGDFAPFYPFAAAYFPPRRGAPRLVRLFMEVRDAWGFADHWTRRLVNYPPAIMYSYISPPASSPVRVRFGEEVTVRVTATDPEGGEVVLAKERGPGEFPEVRGWGSVTGTYTWTARSRQTFHRVRFRAEDPPFEGAVWADLFIRVLQPPRVYGGYATVPRGGTVTASLYVLDPDTPAKDLAFSFSPPKGITVHLLRVEDPPYYYGSYYGYTARVEVSVDRHLCPGSYAVPFKVSDGDYTESGTLQVRVVGNQPPVGQVDGLTVEGRNTRTRRVREAKRPLAEEGCPAGGAGKGGRDERHARIGVWVAFCALVGLDGIVYGASPNVEEFLPRALSLRNLETHLLDCTSVHIKDCERGLRPGMDCAPVPKLRSAEDVATDNSGPLAEE